ncbi:MAG: hypothetical protein O2816_05130 [Planctomycetota bacterium]|nr:hypothetical protein [Planctomycetota bacterium]
MTEANTSESGPKPTPAKPAEMPADVLEFIQAVDDYKRIHSRPFPNWSEVFVILKDLGYQKATH